jgi:23S rRNA U2552 (ribose-2'-O)-methylase RlmE/FtsJ
MDCGTRPECTEIADKAVKKTFAILGVDIDKPESVEEFRQDLRFGKRLRKIADHSTLAFVSVVIVALAGAMWLGLVSKIKGE